MFSTATMPNGLRIVHRQNNSHITHCGLYIGVGSRHEEGEEEGMAHFIEHCIFKGTRHRKAYHILNRIDGIGGELNAFTTKEETCLYSSALSSYLERSMELLSDIIFNSTFPPSEIEKEKDVVIEEIDSYRDSPADLIYDEFEEYFFKGTPLAHNILGTKKNVRRFKSVRMLEFLQRNYTPDRMVLSVVGPNSFKQVLRLANKYFGNENQNQNENENRKPLRACRLHRSLSCLRTNENGNQNENHSVWRDSVAPFTIELSRHTHQSHVMLGCEAPDAYSDDKVAFSLLNNILGGPAMNSRLNVAIRERYGFCYSIESQYTPFSDRGLFTIYAGIDGREVQRYIELVNKEMKSICESVLTSSKLNAAKRQYIGLMALNNESALNEMQSIGKAMLTYNRVDSLEEMRSDIESLTGEQLLSVANRYLNPEGFSRLVYK